jgi:hypothetical protein
MATMAGSRESWSIRFLGVGNRLAGTSWPDSLEMKMTRPQFFFSIPGKYFRCETDTTQHIYLEKSHPICVGDFLKPQEAFDPLILHCEHQQARS